MKKILFLTTRNVISTCGELRLIKNRTETLYTEYGYETDFLVISRKKITEQEPIGSSSTMKVFRYSLKNPLSYVKMKHQFKKELKKRLAEQNYQMIVVSGAKVLQYFKKLKKLAPDAKIFADIHGAFEELIEFKKETPLKRILATCFYYYVKYVEKKYLPQFPHIFVVSYGLKNYLMEQYHVEGEMHIVPCSIKRTKLDLAELKKKRTVAREKYGIKDTDILFIYSGGVSPWQCIEESVEVFRKLKEKEQEKRCRMLILSNNLEYIKRFEADDIMVDSLGAEEIPNVLPAADFAFMLRQDFVTNHVAYPNKFLEYIAAGAKVIATPFVYDVSSQIQEFGLGFLLQDTGYQETLCTYCFEKAVAYGDDFAQRQKLLDDLCFEKRLEFTIDMRN